MEFFGDIPVRKVNLAIAEDYKVRLAKGRSKSAANGYLANFKPFWKWLFNNGEIDNNPFYGLRRYRITKVRRKTFAAIELSRMLRIASRIWRVRICMGLLGCRRGEVLNLAVCDLNWEESHILLSPKVATEYTWPWDLKDHAIRMVALPECMNFYGVTVYLHRDLLRLIEDLGDGQPYFCVEEKYYKKLICWQQDNILTDIHTSDPVGNFQRSFRKLQERAGVLPTKRFHELRAAFTTKMLSKENGIGLERTADALGHSSVDTTREYDRRTQESLIADIGRLTENCYQT